MTPVGQEMAQKGTVFRAATALHLMVPTLSPREAVVAIVVVLQAMRHPSNAALQAGGEQIFPYQATEEDAAKARAVAMDSWIATLDCIAAGADAS